MSCACQLVNNTLATEKNVGNLRVCEGCNHFQITRNEFYHNSHPNNFEYSHKVHFSKSFFRKNISNFTDLHNEKNQIWKVHVNIIVSVTGTRVNVYEIL